MDLTPTHLRMIDLALRGFRMTEIAEMLGTTVGSVRTAFYRMRKEMGCHTQLQLLLRFASRK